MSRPAIRQAAFALGVALLLPLTACSALGTTAETCIDWVYFETPADAAAEADAVVIGRVVDRAGTTDYLDMPAATWNVVVDDWISGDDGGAEIVVTSLPRGCGDSKDSVAAAAGDDPVALFLRDTEEGWQAITPMQGLVALSPDGGVPAAWPLDLTDQPVAGGDPVGQWGEIGDRRTYLTLDDDGRFTGSNGCNGFSGRWRSDGSAVYFDDVVMSLIMCADQTTWLPPLNAALVDGDTLQILDEHGEVKGTLPRVP